MAAVAVQGPAVRMGDDRLDALARELVNGRRWLLPRLKVRKKKSKSGGGGTKHSGARQASGGAGGDQGADAVGLFGADVGVE